jgi:hypothetical protein
MDRRTTRTRQPLPEHGEPRAAECGVCRHSHACYAVDLPAVDAAGVASWSAFHVCLGCLMRAADPAARDACADCVYPG